MANLRTRLPPPNSLIAFEAAARHLSFTRAAEELLVSREAVSRQIRLLEKNLGLKLFDRLYRTLALTAAGRALAPEVQDSLERIAATAARLRGPHRPARLTIGATVAIATFWLTPRLPRFRARHPEAEIRIVVSDHAADMIANGIDIALRYGDGNWPGLTAARLFDIASFPVCAPEYLARSEPIRRASDLLGHTLLNLDGASHAPEDWTWWLVESGVRMPASLRTLGFDNYANVVQAALGGQGIALGYSGIVDDLVAAGRLIRPVPTTFSKGHAVYLVRPTAAAGRADVEKFRAWILSEVGI